MAFPPAILGGGFSGGLPTFGTIPGFFNQGFGAQGWQGPSKGPYSPDTTVWTDAALIDLSNWQRVEFKWMPDSFQESKAAEYASVNIIGRSEPMMGYSHSGGRNFSLRLVFAIIGAQQPEAEILGPIRLLRSWVYPDYSGSLPATPHPLLLVAGNWLSQRVILLNYQITYHSPW